MDDATLLIKISLSSVISLSTTVVGGGLKQGVKYAVFRTVHKDFSEDPVEYSLKVLSDLGLSEEETVVFLTATDIKEYLHAQSSVGGVDVEVYMTVGLNKYPTCSRPQQRYGLSKAEDSVDRIGTVNTLVITNCGLSPQGITDLLRLTAELKASLISSLGYSCIDSRACGTSSDAVAVISLRGSSDYAGSATAVGRALTSAMYEVLSAFVSKVKIQEYLEYVMGGVGLRDLTQVAVKAYAEAPIPNLSIEEFAKIFQEELLKALKDVNTLLLIRAMRSLDEVAHLTKGLNWREFSSDTKAVVADELLGCALADYIGGFKAVLCYYWLERLKERGKLPLVSEAPMFTDDLMNSLVAAIMSRIYCEYLRSVEK